MQKNLVVTLSTDIQISDCTIIARAINEENEKKPHMIAISSDNLLENTLRYGWLVARTLNNDLAWFVKLTLLSPEYDLYEWGSLMVLPHYRWKGIGEILIHSIVAKHRERSLLAVTTEIQVIRASIKQPKEQIELQWDDTPDKLRTLIEWPQPLLVDDRVFINHTLHTRVLRWEFV